MTQGAFLVPVAALLGVITVVTPQALTRPSVLLGGALVVLATGLAFLAPREGRVGTLTLLAVPVLDLAAIALLRLLPHTGAVAALVVFPSLWLGLAFRRAGVHLAGLGCVLALTLPGFVLYGTGLDGWTRGILLPIIACTVALSTSLTADAWARQRDQLQQQGADLRRLVRETIQHRQLTEAIVQAVDVGLLAIGRDGTYNSMNPQHREFMRIGYPDGHSGKAGVIGYAFSPDSSTLLEPSDMPAVRAAKGEAFNDFTMWIGKEPSQRRALSVSARPMYDADGELDGAVLAYKDITDLMQALQVKDEFVASVSHELRTPLTSIIGYTDLVLERDDELPRDIVQQLAVVRRNADRLLLLVSDLLSTAQIESRTLRMVLEPSDVGALVQQSVRSLEPRALEAGVALRAEVPSTPEVLVDPARITQVVDNLLSNAVKYTLPGGEVQVRLEAEAAELVLTVTDSGIGIAERDLDQVFTKFFRAESAERRAIPGVGLGLVISKEIIEAHEGRIELESTEGEGTTVRVRLPVTHR
jgi:two-component system phosphate regulon sensor histidine kinase PhoR